MDSGLQEILNRKGLASLGDAYVNFVYSLALTKVTGRPQAVKVSDRILAKCFRTAGLRDQLGRRVSIEDLADASESLLAEAFLRGILTIDESVRTLIQNEEGLEAGLGRLLKLVAERLSLK